MSDPPSYAPFRHQTRPLVWSNRTLMQTVDQAVGVCIRVPIRAFIVVLLFGLFSLATLVLRLFSRLTGQIVDDRQSFFNRIFRACLRYSIRLLFLTIGLAVEERGQQNRGRVIVANHISFFDVLYFCQRSECPSFIAKRSLQSVPVIRLFLENLSCIFAGRSESQSSSESASELFRKRAADPSSPPILIFSEGTTSNGRFVMPFKSGAFAPALPIQPCALSYPVSPCGVSLAWESVPLPYLLFRILAAKSHRMCVQWLPLYSPSADEQKSAALFANSVRNQIATALAVPLTDYGIADKLQYHDDVRQGKTHWQLDR